MPGALLVLQKESLDGTSTGFTLPNGAKRSPDLAWVTRA
jgi:hypothetical protein